MTNPNLLVTGSAGLIGSQAVRHFAALGWTVHGIDNNMRADFFGPDGDTTWNLQRLQRDIPGYRHHVLDIRDRGAVDRAIAEIPAEMIVHAAAQPSHDLAASRPFDDFDVNAGGTLNLLEATRRHRPEATFCFMSTNKVYGDAPNELPLVELETRWEYQRPEDFSGIAEDFRIDRSKHSLFGASKVAADVMVQEYGRYFGMKTVCLRGGCLTGAAHSAAELHGFLAYLARCVVEGRPYRISISMLEAIAKLEAIAGKRLSWEYVDENRAGDHICYISDLSKMKADYPGWDVTAPLDSILEDIVRVLRDRGVD
jgi:CDP-paratose 2-epimerase